MTTEALALGGRELVWTYAEPGGAGFVLHTGGEDIGRFDFTGAAEKRSHGELGGYRYAFEGAGTHHSPIHVYREGSDEVAAKFQRCLTGGGVVEFKNGARYCWTKPSVLSDRWCFRSKENKSTVCLLQETGPLSKGDRVMVCGEAAKLPEMPVLVLLAWYLRLVDFARLVDSIAVCG
jgi:hypothetical protein